MPSTHGPGANGAVAMTDPLLVVEGLNVGFPSKAGVVQAVSDVSFELHAGEVLAVVGESGSGKSVTALSVMQLLPYEYASHPTGSIRVDGREVIGLDEDAMLAIIKNYQGDARTFSTQRTCFYIHRADQLVFQHVASE